MAIELMPKGTRGEEMPRLPRPLIKVARAFMNWFARRAGNRQVILTTVGPRTGHPHIVAVTQFTMFCVR